MCGVVMLNKNFEVVEELQNCTEATIMLVGYYRGGGRVW